MIAVTLLALVAFVLAFRVCVGYPRPATVSAHLSRGEVAFLNAAGEAFAPSSDDLLPRSGAEAELPAFADEYLSALPERQRRLIRMMLIFFEQATLLFPARGVGGFARFSKLDPEQRRQVLEAWESSSLPLRRTLLTALRAFVVMGIVAHRENLAHLGLTPWEIDSPIIESDLLYPSVGQSRSTIAFDESDVATVRNATPLRSREPAS